MNEEQADMDPDPDGEETEDLIPDEKRYHHWRMVFKENDGGAEDQKVILHAKIYYIYINKKKRLLRVGIMFNFQVLMGRRFFGKW